MQISYLAAVLAVVAVTASAYAQDITLVKDGKSEYTIVLSKEASLSEKHAAGELQDFLRQISGAELPIVTEGARLPNKMIVIGDGEARKALGVHIGFDQLGDEGFAIRSAGPNIVIAGGRLRGTLYGVYTFLERLGCRWYTSKVSRIPKMRTIVLPQLDIAQKPAFEYREPFYTDAFDADWAVRNLVNSNSARLDEKRGGKVEYGRFVHTFAELIPPSVYYKDHPEYFSLVDGKRQDGYAQICMSNPDVLRIATEKVMKWIEEKPTAKIFSVSQNDCYLNCQCDKCKAIDEEEGSPSGLLLRFVNAIAEEVEKKYPDKLIDTLAYQWTEKPPRITKPRANVRVRLCPIFACEFHDYTKCEQNAGFVENLRNWAKITNNLYIWHYNTDFPHYLIPFPDLDQIATSIRLYKRTGVKGIFMEGNYSPGGGGFMDELKAYYIAKLLWNPWIDEKAVKEDFLNGYFGKAGKPIGEWLDMLHEKVRKENIHGNIWIGVDGAHLSPEIMQAGERLFDEAERLADNQDVLERVKHARLSLEYVKVARECSQIGAHGTPEQKSDTLKRLESFVKECKADGITNISEGASIDAWFESMAAPLRK